HYKRHDCPVIKRLRRNHVVRVPRPAVPGASVDARARAGARRPHPVRRRLHRICRPEWARSAGRAVNSRRTKEVRVHVAKRIASLVFALLFLVAARKASADTKEALEQLKTLSQSATGAYQDGGCDRARTRSTGAITLAKDNGLSTKRIMAQVYILFGVLKINEHKDIDGGIKYFPKAIAISPAVKIPPTMATKAVKAAFAKAEDVDPATIGDLTEGDSGAKTSQKDSTQEAA